HILCFSGKLGSSIVPAKTFLRYRWCPAQEMDALGPSSIRLPGSCEWNFRKAESDRKRAVVLLPAAARRLCALCGGRELCREGKFRERTKSFVLDGKTCRR